jgi:hypothetical protein
VRKLRAAGDRPEPTLSLWPASGGNAPVTSRSLPSLPERQLLNSANSHFRPGTAFHSLYFDVCYYRVRSRTTISIPDFIYIDYLGLPLGLLGLTERG